MNEAIFALCEEATFYPMSELISSLDIDEDGGDRDVGVGSKYHS